MKKRRNDLFYSILLTPSLLFMLVVVVFPLFYTLFLSLQQYDLTNPLFNRFVGLDNYINMLKSSRFWASLGRTLIFTAVTTALSFLFGFILAMLLNRRDIILNNVFRSIFLIPMIMAPMVIGATFRYIMNYDFGILNYMLSAVGLPKIAFLGDSAWALFAVILVDIWQWTPFMILVLLAGFESLPDEPYEAARIDGAGFWEEMRYLTLPFLRPVISVALLFRIIDAFRDFDKIHMMTSGGPGSASETLGYYVYRTGFSWFQMGDASAMGIFMMYSVVFIGWLYLKTLGSSIFSGGDD